MNTAEELLEDGESLIDNFPPEIDWSDVECQHRMSQDSWGNYIMCVLCRKMVEQIEEQEMGL